MDDIKIFILLVFKFFIDVKTIKLMSCGKKFPRNVYTLIQLMSHSIGM